VCYSVVIGYYPRADPGFFPTPFREFLMAGSAEFGKITAAGPAAGVEAPRQ